MATDSAIDGPPPGMKLLAWQGVGLFVPIGWELGKYQGDHVAGGFRIDAPDRTAAQVRWWMASRRLSIETLLEQYRRAVLGPAGRDASISVARWLGTIGSPANDVNANDVNANDVNANDVNANDVNANDVKANDVKAYDVGPDAKKPEGGGPREVLVLAREASEGRVALLRFFVGEGEAHRPMLSRMLAGIRVQPLSARRDFAVLDFSVRGPEGMRIEQSSLACGVCRMQFRRRGERIALRRYSAANAAMATWTPGRASFEAWAKVTYSAEFHDMKYAMDLTYESPDVWRLELSGKRRWFAPLEMSWLIPRHRNPPRNVLIRWYEKENKIVCVEAGTPELMEKAGLGVLESVRFVDVSQEVESSVVPTLTGTPWPGEREKPVAWRVRRGRTAVVVETVESGERRVTIVVARKRSATVRFLRALAAQPTGPADVDRLGLDMMGMLLWDACAGATTVSELIELARLRMRVTRREAAQAVVEYIRATAARGIFELEVL